MAYSIQQLKKMIKEERESADDYESHGMKAIARDERKHAFFLEMQLKRKQERE